MFDTNSGTYILPPNFGGVDVESGSYQAPEGLVMTHDGTFAAATAYDPVAVADSAGPGNQGQFGDDGRQGRAPASIGPNGEAGPNGPGPDGPGGPRPDGSANFGGPGGETAGAAPGPEIFNPIAPGIEPPPSDAFFDPAAVGSALGPAHHHGGHHGPGNGPEFDPAFGPPR